MALKLLSFARLVLRRPSLSVPRTSSFKLPEKLFSRRCLLPVTAVLALCQAQPPLSTPNVLVQAFLARTSLLPWCLPFLHSRSSSLNSEDPAAPALFKAALADPLPEVRPHPRKIHPSVRNLRSMQLWISSRRAIWKLLGHH